jgi:UDP-N-acetylmuramyl pentapeptide phosphotransferase/UDP-N-acetylglucosamine-1-phosphate transferase
MSKRRETANSFLMAMPLHSHFEALGWPGTKVTMRLWVIGQVAAFVGVILFILGGTK